MSKDLGKEVKECIIIGGGISGAITATVLVRSGFMSMSILINVFRMALAVCGYLKRHFYV